MVQPHSNSCWVTTTQAWVNGSLLLRRQRWSISSKTSKGRYLIWSHAKTTSILTSRLSYFKSSPSLKMSLWLSWTHPAPRLILRRRNNSNWVKPYPDSPEGSKNISWWGSVLRKRRRVKRIDLQHNKILNTRWHHIPSSIIVHDLSQCAESISPMPTKSKNIKYSRGKKLTTKSTMKKRLNTLLSILLRMRSGNKTF